MTDMKTQDMKLQDIKVQDVKLTNCSTVRTEGLTKASISGHNLSFSGLVQFRYDPMQCFVASTLCLKKTHKLWSSVAENYSNLLHIIYCGVVLWNLNLKSVKKRIGAFELWYYSGWCWKSAGKIKFWIMIYWKKSEGNNCNSLRKWHNRNWRMLGMC